MNSRSRKADGLLQNPDAMRALLADPREWLRRHGLSESDVACTDDAHAALERAEKVAMKANELKDLPLLEALPRLRDLAALVWDGDVEVERIPFGVMVAQRPTVPQVPIIDDNPEKKTATGSIRCTFAVSCKADVDD